MHDSRGSRLAAIIAAVIFALSPALCFAGPCNYSLSYSNAAFSAGASGGSFGVLGGSGCAWSATPSNSWLHSTSAGSGNGTVNFTVDANTSPMSRTGIIAVVPKVVFTVTQAGVPVTLGQALENTNLTWETSPDYPWYGTNPPAPTYDGLFSAVSSNRNVPNSTSWLRTTVVGPGTLSFWWKVDSEIYPPPPDTPWSIDALEVDLNGAMLDRIMGQVDWNYRSYAIPAGTIVVMWQFVKDAQYNSFEDRGWISQVIYTTNSPMALQEALNTCGVAWASGGNSNPTFWTGQSGVSHDGYAAARSGAIAANQETWLDTSVSGVTNVSFWWRVSSETNADWLEFYTNGTLARRISGEVAWQSNYFKLASGTNNLHWRFVKDTLDIAPKGQDCGWLDQVTFGPTLKASPYYLATPAWTTGAPWQLLVIGEAGCPCSIEVSTNFTTWTTLTNFITPGTNSLLLDATAPDAPTRFYRALSPGSF